MAYTHFAPENLEYPTKIRFCIFLSGSNTGFSQFHTDLLNGIKPMEHISNSLSEREFNSFLNVRDDNTNQTLSHGGAGIVWLNSAR